MVSAADLKPATPATDCCADDLKDVIQHLFEIQSAVHGYLGPETQQELVRKMYESPLFCRPLPELTTI